jgi:hypothetical protein
MKRFKSIEYLKFIKMFELILTVEILTAIYLLITMLRVHLLSEF